MNVKDLRAEVQQLAPPSIKNSWELKSAFDFFQKNIQAITNDDITSLALNIIGMAISLHGPNDPTIFEWDLVKNDFLIDLIEPIVTQTRISIFNNPEVPFKNFIEAGNWIYKESAKPIPKDKEVEAKRFLDFYNSYMSSKLKGEIWQCGTSIEFENLTITFPGIKEENTGWTESVPVGWSNKLLMLSKDIHQISNIVDFPEYEITAHILTGMKPFLPKYRIETPFFNSKFPSNNWFTRNQVIIRINAVDVTFDDLKKIYKEYRKRLNYTRKKGITNKQLLIYKMVQNAGGVPNKGRTKFWHEIVEKWNNEYPNDIYTRWEGIYKAYNGIKTKITS